MKNFWQIKRNIFTKTVILIALCIVSLKYQNGGLLGANGLMMKPPNHLLSGGSNMRPLSSNNLLSSSLLIGEHSDDAVAVAKLKREAELEKITAMITRVPSASLETFRSMAYSFLTSCAILIPIGLVMHLNKISQLKGWMKLGVDTGVEWSKIGAFYTGGEVLCRHLRDVDDDYNTYIGSGLAAALLRFDDGPLGMLQGFAIGYGFMFAIERFFVDNPPPALATSNRSPTPNRYTAHKHQRVPFTTRNVNYKVPGSGAAATAASKIASTSQNNLHRTASRGQQLTGKSIAMPKIVDARRVRLSAYGASVPRYRIPPASSSQKIIKIIIRRRGQV